MVHSVVVLMEVPIGLGRKSASLTADNALSVRKVSSILTHELDTSLTMYR